MEYNFEQAIEKLLQEQRKTKKSLYEHLGLTRQGFDNKLKNQTVSVLELSQMATFFDMEEADLIAVLANRPTVAREACTKTDDYLREHLMKLEESFALLQQQFQHQLSVKDIQIAGLQRTVDALITPRQQSFLKPATRAESTFLLNSKISLTPLVA